MKSDPFLCGKTRYPTSEDAHRALAALRRKSRGRTKAERRSYRCPACQSWHICSSTENFATDKRLGKAGKRKKSRKP